MRNILIVVDMQNDFIDGALGTAEAVAIVANVVDKIRTYDPADIYVTLDTHQPDYLATQEGRNLPVEHCIRGTAGWQLRDEIAAALGINPDGSPLADCCPDDCCPDGNCPPDCCPDAGPHVYEKPTFGSTALAEDLKALCEREKGELAIELVGLCTDICVVSNALLLKAAMPEVPISVDPACCAGVTPASHEAALATMKMCQIAV